MGRSDYVKWVEQASAGDLDAFSRLVDAFQDLVTGAAFGWLGDAEQARDVSQESFLDAYAHLPELRNPAAFPGWLRRIVIKHCDRLTRRPTVTSVPLEPDTIAAGETPEAQAARNERASDVRLAVGNLPPQERIVVALSYFAELSGPESAEFLGLPLSTIKKRLRSARSRLRERGDTMHESLQPLRPSRTRDFTKLVTYFLAIRQGDHARVRNLLRHSPDLANAVQDWPAELVTEGVLPFASRTTALITAIERDDIILLELLLDAGADVNGPCDCATAESPTWAATLLNRTRHLRTLLARGADADSPSASGSRPLHVAAMRGHANAAELLLAHGADPTARDRHGLSPHDWARLNGHFGLAERLAAGPARVADPRKQPAELRRTERTEPVWFTGIKALDLFCPVPRGGLVRVPFTAGVGMVVLMGELCDRMTRSASGLAIWTGFAQRPFDVKDWRTEMSELGILPRVAHSLADLDASAEARRAAFRSGLERATALRERGFDVLMVLLTDHGFEGDVEASFPGLLERRAPGSITTFVITPPFDEQADAAWPPQAAPYAAQLRLDRARANRGLFPAVHPALSWSTMLTAAGVGPEHVRVADAAKKLLVGHANVDPELSAVEQTCMTDPHFATLEHTADTPRQDDGQSRAIALLRYLSQPFFVAEPFTTRPGSWVGRERLLNEVAGILNA